jgi:hypothetical protein
MHIRDTVERVIEKIELLKEEAGSRLKGEITLIIAPW